MKALGYFISLFTLAGKLLCTAAVVYIFDPVAQWADGLDGKGSS